MGIYWLVKLCFIGVMGKSGGNSNNLELWKSYEFHDKILIFNENKEICFFQGVVSNSLGF